MVFSKLGAIENPSRSKYDRVCRDAAVEFLEGVKPHSTLSPKPCSESRSIILETSVSSLEVETPTHKPHMSVAPKP